MGRKVVWNGEAPNAVHYNTLDEVVQIIQEERKHIRKTDEALAKEVRKFITLSDDWLKVPYSVNTINPVDRTIGNGNVLPVKSAQDEYVTVIMNTVGEDPEVLRTAIKSYLNQNNVQVQLIISTIAGDPSLLLADELRLDVSVSPNKGIYEQLNYALQYVEGDWFCYASGNDLASPDKLQDETRLCIENKKLICYSDFKIVNEKWEPTGSRHFHEYDISRHLQGNFVSDCALIHRSIIDRFAPFDLRWGNHAYWDFWLRVYKALGDVFIYNRRAEWFYRVDGRNQHVQRKSDPVKKQANKDLMEKMLAYHRKSIRFK
jgi:glycosyltransferase involved in cell wall biosynthesis